MDQLLFISRVTLSRINKKIENKIDLLTIDRYSSKSLNVRLDYDVSQKILKIIP